MKDFLRRIFGLKIHRVLSDGSTLTLSGYSAKDVDRLTKWSEETVAALATFSDEDLERLAANVQAELAAAGLPPDAIKINYRRKG